MVRDLPAWLWAATPVSTTIPGARRNRCSDKGLNEGLLKEGIDRRMHDLVLTCTDHASDAKNNEIKWAQNPMHISPGYFLVLGGLCKGADPETLQLKFSPCRP